MENPGIRSLGDFSITSAATQTGTDTYDSGNGVDLSGILAASFHFRFVYGSGGTNVKAYLQTSLNQGTSSTGTWMDIICVVFTTANEVAEFNLSGLTPKTTQVTPTDGSLADDTVVDGILGDRFRVKVVSTGTYAGTTTLECRMCAR